MTSWCWGKSSRQGRSLSSCRGALCWEDTWTPPTPPLACPYMVGCYGDEFVEAGFHDDARMMTGTLHRRRLHGQLRTGDQTGALLQLAARRANGEEVSSHLLGAQRTLHQQRVQPGGVCEGQTGRGNKSGCFVFCCIRCNLLPTGERTT